MVETECMTLMSLFRKTLDWFSSLGFRRKVTMSSTISVHPDTHRPNIAWDKLKVKQKVEKVGGLILKL